MVRLLMRMLIDRNLLEEYPFSGAFYKYAIDESKPLDEQVEEEILVLETACDIQEAQKSDAYGNITASFNVYFPIDKEQGVSIIRGMTFKGSIYGLAVNGKVLSVAPSQLGGCMCSIKDLDV